MRDSDKTRDLIISKAACLFNTRGYRGTSLSDITRVTGVTKGAIYGNFENKDALALAAFEASASRIISDLKKWIKAQATAPLKLKAIINYYAEYIEKPPIQGGCPLINTAVEADDDYPLLRMKVVATLTMIKDSLKKIINRGILEGQIAREVDVEAFATMLYATIEGGVVMARIEGVSRSYDTIKEGLEKQIDAISI